MDWRRMFQPHILDRGLEYYQNGLVEDYETDCDYVQATVQGNDEYDVHIDFVNGNIHDMECDCPYAAKGNYCKHMAAVLFCMEGKTEGVVSKNQDKKYNNVLPSAIVEGSIGKLVEAADETVIKKFLVEILENDEKLYSRFKSIICCDISPEDVKRYKKQINEIFRKYAGRQDFIDYYNADSFVSELEDFLNNDIAGMLNNEQYREAFELTNYIFVKTGNQDMDDSDGGTGVLADMCREIWQEILEHCDLKLKKEMFRWFMKHLDGSVIDYMEEYIEEFLFVNFKEKEFLDDKIKFTEDKIRQHKQESDGWSRDYHAGNWAVRHIELLKEKKMPQDKIWKYCQDNMDLRAVRKYYVDECIDKKDFETAIQVLKEGKEKEKSLAGVVADYSLRLKELYRQTGKTEEFIEELWLLLLKYKVGDVTVFQELKGLYTQEEWEDKRELIFNKLPAYAAVDKLYKEEKLYDRLLKVVLDSPGLYKLTEYEKCLKKLYPEELLNQYEMVVKNMAVHTSDRKRYREMVVILKRMKSYSGGKKRVDEIVENWKSVYKNRSAMMDELKRL